jgi:SAM-dependent methyltransferase
MTTARKSLHWSDSDEFWEKTYPFEFNNKRFEAAPKEIETLLQLVKAPRHARILDLCCGPGRHSIELALRGFDVTGVDRTAFYIHVARESAARKNLSVDFQVADARTFSRPQHFDIALNLWTSFGYFDTEAEDLSLLRNACTSLRSGGHFIIETLNSYQVVKTIHQVDTRELESGILIEESTLVNDKKVIATHWTLLPAQGQKTDFDFSVRLYSPDELQALLEKVGFTDIRKFGDMDGRPFNHKSGRIVIRATKI